MGRPKGSKNGHKTIYICKTCGKEFISDHTTAKYCSWPCFHTTRILRKYEICELCGTKFENPHQGGQYKRRKYCSSGCFVRACANRLLGSTHVTTPEWRKKIGEAQRGERGNNWKGGKTKINKLLRKSPEFKAWREAIFSRDNWTCTECEKRGEELHPDHIKPFSLFPELRFDVNNGRTLCRDCHIKTPTWGVNGRKYTRSYFELASL